MEVYRTAPIPYRVLGEYDDPTILGVYYKPNKPPYVESLAWFIGMSVQHATDIKTGKYGTPYSPCSVYLFANMHQRSYHPAGNALWRFDGKTGAFIKRMYPRSAPLFQYLVFASLVTSRLGRMYAIHLYGSSMRELILGVTATASVGDEPEGRGDSWGYGTEVISDDRFNISGFGACAIDDTPRSLSNDSGDLFLSGKSTGLLSVFRWTTGEFLYSIQMPQGIKSICLEDNQRCYVMLTDQTLVLVDYMRGEIMGAVKIPTLTGAKDGDAWGGATIAWDSLYRRILVAQELPNDPITGASTSYIRGFRQVPIPVRLTTPIPLKAPRQGRQIPVLVQAVGDMNEGVGGYNLSVTVQGSGMLMGTPVSDHVGNTLVQVLCSQYDVYGYGYDLDYNLPPPPAGPGPIIPYFTPTTQQIGIGMFDDMVGPRIMDYTETPSANVRAIFFDTRDPENLAPSMDVSDELGWPVEIYKDGYGLDPDDVPSGTRALIFAYPTEGAAVSTSLQIVRANMNACANAHVPMDLACAAYCQYRGPGDYALTEQKVLDMLGGMWDLAREFHVGSIWLFSKARFHGEVLVDGVDFWQSIATAVQRMKEASADWTHFPAA
jgi:hypothetical protein